MGDVRLAGYGLAATRELAETGQAGGPGLANVRFLSLGRLAELLGAARLAAAGRSPAGAAVRREAVRTSLRARPGPLRAVVEHPATVRAVQRALDELAALPAHELAAVQRQSERARHVVALAGDVAHRLRGHYDEHELARSAAAAVGDGNSALRDVGHVIAFLPRRLSPAELTLLRALARRDALSAIVGLTGDDQADGPAHALAAQLGLGAPAPAPALAVAFGDEIRTVADAEEEAREAARVVLERLAAGVPLHRIGVLSPPSREYSALVQEQLSAAAIPFSGPAPRTLAQSAAGTTLRGLLELAQSDLPRDAVMAWLTAAPILEMPGGQEAPAARWDLLSRSAGVVGGLGQWHSRLAEQGARSQRERADLEALDELTHPRAARLDAEIDHAARLGRFIESLAAALRPEPRSTWAELGSWASGLLRRYLGDPQRRAEWPAGEAEAARAIEQRLGALAALDHVSAGADLAALRRAIAAELDAAAGRAGRFGEGVFAGRVADAAGLDFDTVVILGMAEGLLPSRGGEDPLLPEQARAAAGSLRRRADTAADQRRDYLAALSAARRRVLLYSRADERAGRQRQPSRWLLESAARHSGRPFFSENLAHLGATSWHVPGLSYEGALAHREPVAERDWTLRALLRRDAASPLRLHPLIAEDPQLIAGLAAHAQRQRGGLSPRNGMVGPAPGLTLNPETPVSPSALQDYASCPLRYFLGRVLRVTEAEQPAEEEEITPLERGSLVHEILARFLDEVALKKGPVRPEQEWSAEDRERLRAIARTELDDREARGRTGKALVWRLERERILADLDDFLAKDAAMRARLGVAPAHAELAFGGTTAPVVFDPVGAPPVALQGRIDRLDRAPDGSRLAVIDYKTGRGRAYAKALEEDPTARGQLLQLPVYALAARARYGDVPVSARYWFVTANGEFREHGYDIDGDVLARFADAVGTVAEGIRAGRFPARPGPSATSSRRNCAYCPYDLICPADRERIWERTRSDPALARYVAMAEPELEREAQQ
ncbi:MAG TPA: PD-(D/E)XK nuclease family protein [Egibacteraceae bacterium]|nr:PD-(D/E)XK nuclease family protein [Egibacteraceae bacterium]